MSYYEENNKAQYNFQSIGRPGTWRSNSMDVLPYVESDNDYQYPPGSTLAKLSQLSQLAQQQQQLNKHGASAAAVNHKMSMMRSSAFETATQFTDQYYPVPIQEPDQPDYNNVCQDTSNENQEVSSVAGNQSHQRQHSDQVMAAGPGFNNITMQGIECLSSANVSQPQGGDHVGTQLINSRDQQHGGSNEDMKKVLMSLDNTGYFAEELLDSSDVTQNNNKIVQQQQKQHQQQQLPHQQLQQQQHQQQQMQMQVTSNKMDYKKLWEDSKMHNMQLQKELGEVKSDLESVRCQLETMAIRAVNQKSVSDAEKREKLIVIKKLEGLEKELKLLAYSESLTDQTLDQLRVENNRLREENLALLRVMDKIVKN